MEPIESLKQRQLYWGSKLKGSSSNSSNSSNSSSGTAYTYVPYDTTLAGDPRQMPNVNFETVPFRNKWIRSFSFGVRSHREGLGCTTILTRVTEKTYRRDEQHQHKQNNSTAAAAQHARPRPLHSSRAAAEQQQSSSRAAAEQQQSSSRAAAEQQQSSNTVVESAAAEAVAHHARPRPPPAQQSGRGARWDTTRKRVAMPSRISNETYRRLTYSVQV